MLFDLKKRKEIEYVYLDGNIDYVFCFKRKTVIEEENCDYYEYNRKCEQAHDYLHRTHRKGSNGGGHYVGDSTPILNECDYCLKQGKPKKYCLSYEARKYFK